MSPEPRSAAAVCYVESSALTAAIIENDEMARESIRLAETPVTSRLTLAETARAIIRAAVAGRITEEVRSEAIAALETFSQRCGITEVSARILERAGRRFPVEPVRTLDAVHLATIEMLGEWQRPIAVLTRDVRVRENVLALGFVVE